MQCVIHVGCWELYPKHLHLCKSQPYGGFCTVVDRWLKHPTQLQKNHKTWHMREVSGRETARAGQTWGQHGQKETQSTGGWDAQKTKRLPGENPEASSGKTNTWPVNFLKALNQNKAWLLLIVLQMWNKTLRVITLLYARPLAWVSVLGKRGSLKDGEQSLLGYPYVAQVDFWFATLSLQPTQSWSYRHAPPFSTS